MITFFFETISFLILLSDYHRELLSYVGLHADKEKTIWWRKYRYIRIWLLSRTQHPNDSFELYPNEGVRIINMYIYSGTVINLYVEVTEVWGSWLELLMKYSSRLLMYSLYEILCAKWIIVINVFIERGKFQFHYTSREVLWVL